MSSNQAAPLRSPQPLGDPLGDDLVHGPRRMQAIQPEIFPHTDTAPRIKIVILPQIIEPFPLLASRLSLVLGVEVATLRHVLERRQTDLVEVSHRQGGLRMHVGEEGVGVVPEERGIRVRLLEGGDEGGEAAVIVGDSLSHGVAIAGALGGGEMVAVARAVFVGREVRRLVHGRGVQEQEVAGAGDVEVVELGGVGGHDATRCRGGGHAVEIG